MENSMMEHYRMFAVAHYVCIRMCMLLGVPLEVNEDQCFRILKQHTNWKNDYVADCLRAS
jgi:hypothetical protein